MPDSMETLKQMAQKLGKPKPGKRSPGYFGYVEVPVEPMFRSEEPANDPEQPPVDDKDLIDANYYLVQWGAWMRTLPADDIGFKRYGNFATVKIEEKGYKSTLEIESEYCEAVDKLLAQKYKDEVELQVVLFKFVGEYSHRAIERYMSADRRTIAGWLTSVTSFLSGYLTAIKDVR